MTPLPGAEAVLRRALAARAFSAVTAEVGRGGSLIWTYAAGQTGFDAAAVLVSNHTVFDLASLTKVLATTTLALDLVNHGVLDLSRRVQDYLPQWSGSDRDTVTVRDLLEHSSGLPAYRDYFRSNSGRREFIAAIAAEPLEYAPRTRSTYSDLGFIVLGFIVSDVGGAPLDEQFSRFRARERLTAPLAYLPPPDWRLQTAFTEEDPWRGRVLQGEVHDENAAALGGVAAHAGLFGTAGAVGEIARWWLTHRDTANARDFLSRSRAPGSSRALGWDTMLPTSSCGVRLSTRAFGHTGFTGTSLWIDPERDLYIVLLTNRVHPTRANNRIQDVRRDFHDAVVADFDTQAF
ncbi:MAG: beta-lactamase family protein [Acidobacteria bacterium]|nr:beta-lactamase family protein [Acidobacteriota bacterium]